MAQEMKLLKYAGKWSIGSLNRALKTDFGVWPQVELGSGHVPFVTYCFLHHVIRHEPLVARMYMSPNSC